MLFTPLGYAAGDEEASAAPPPASPDRGAGPPRALVARPRFAVLWHSPGSSGRPAPGARCGGRADVQGHDPARPARRREQEAFRSWLLDRHAPLAATLPGLRRLTYNLVEGDDAPYRRGRGALVRLPRGLRRRLRDGDRRGGGRGLHGQRALAHAAVRRRAANSLTRGRSRADRRGSLQPGSRPGRSAHGHGAPSRTSPAHPNAEPSDGGLRRQDPVRRCPPSRSGSRRASGPCGRSSPAPPPAGRGRAIAVSRSRCSWAISTRLMLARDRRDDDDPRPRAHLLDQVREDAVAAQAGQLPVERVVRLDEAPGCRRAPPPAMIASASSRAGAS